MKSYPSITTKFNNQVPLVIFDKLDGSNIRAEWSKKKGFYKFGTRTRLVDESDPMLGGTPKLIQDKYGDDLARIFQEQRYERAIAFFEFWGPKSFAGSHDLTSTENTVTLIDVNPYKKGILAPQEFIELFWDVELPSVLHKGRLTTEIVDRVKASTLNGMTFEGVVCKYAHPKLKHAAMFKIKSRAWLAALHDYVDGDEAAFRRLA